MDASACARSDDFLKFLLFPQRLFQRLLAGNESWPSFLNASIETDRVWNDCPEIVEEALERMATTTIGLLDIVNVGPLKPVCKAFAALIEAAQGTTEAAEHLNELISWCSSPVGVFIEHGQ